MAKALFLSLPLHGHTNPTLPLVRELVAHGESIVYFSSPPFVAKIEHAGGHYRPYRNAFLEEIRDLPERVHQLAWLLMRATAEVLDEELEIFRAERPDYIICDSVAPWGQCVGQLLRIPVVTSISTFAFNRRVLAYAATRGIRPKSARIFVSKVRHVFKALLLRGKVRRRHGVAPGMMEIVSGRSDLNIVYTSRYFQPRAESFDERYQFVGPSISARLSTETFPWDRVRDAMVVYVSLGTVFNAEPDFFRACIEAFRHAPYHVIMSIGSNIPAMELGAVPPNFTVRPHVPQLEVLQRTRVFVTHGGMNSVSESLYYGVPVLVVPQVGEQAIVGKRAEELGAGSYLPKKEVTAATLRKMVDQLAANELVRKKATEIGDSFRNAGGVARARDAILNYTRKENPDISQEPNAARD